jgi:L-ascorbate metabolism protein UlaG (beta-lactamase superfamily)
MQRTGARLYGGATAIRLAKAAGARANECHKLQASDVHVIGPWTVHVFAAKHDRLFGSVPFNGVVTSDEPARRPSNWKVGEPLAFFIEGGGRKVYIDSGGTPDELPPSEIAPVDLAILGVALPESRKRIPAALDQLRPRFFLPSHQDDFFAPFERGFIFGKLTDFPAIARLADEHQISARLILLDYFRPWTIP